MVAAPPRPTTYGTSNQTIMRHMKQNFYPGMVGGSMTPSMSQNVDMDLFNQQTQQQAMDRAMLAQLQAQWDANYAGR